MQIILQEDVEKLGHRGDVVTVKPGYARNFLLPRKLGIAATLGNMKALERIRTSLAKKTATELDAAHKQAELLNGVAVRFALESMKPLQLDGLQLGVRGQARSGFGPGRAAEPLELTLEAETLVDDFLAEEGRHRYIIEDDEFSRLGRIVELVNVIRRERRPYGVERDGRAAAKQLFLAQAFLQAFAATAKRLVDRFRR